MFPTRAEKILDQIFSNFNDCYNSPDCLGPIGRSDHSAIIWRPVSRVQQCVKLRVRNFSFSNSVAFFSAINNYDWLSLVKESSSLKDSIDAFQGCISYLFELFFRPRIIRVRDREPPWMKTSLKILINDRDRAFANKEFVKYRSLREKVIKHTKFLKSTYLQRAIDSGDVRRLWCAIGVLG